VIDDEPSGLETVEALLHADPYALDFATSGAEGLERLRTKPFDLIICDVMMPGMDGFEVCRESRAHPEWRFVPIILLTALDGDDDMVRGIEAGADDFLTKPVQRIVLRARVRALLRVHDHFDQLRAAASDVDSLLRARRERISGHAGLTEREQQVLELLLLGRNHEEMSKLLGITPRTTKHHQASVLEKLGADSRVDLVRIFL